MNIEELRDFCISMDGVTEKTPFGKFARRYESILVFYVMDHMFCFADMDAFTSVTVRSTPDEIEELCLSRSSVSKPLNRSLRYWIQLDFGGDIPESEIYALIRKAYSLVERKYKKKIKN